MPRSVSVIVPTRDRSTLLRAALSSIRRLEAADLWLEILVVDNGTDLETESVATELGARYLRTREDGPAAARNVGIRAATGTFLAFLDDDDEWLAGHLQPHLDLMDRRPDVVAVFGQAVTCDYDLRPTSVPWPVSIPEGVTPFEQLFGYYPQIGATVARASAVRSTGLFDESLRSDEDWDWQLRLALGGAIAFVQTPCVAFRQWPDGTADRDDLWWTRFSDSKDAFWRNVRRAGRSRPTWSTVLARYAGFRGMFARHFLESASSLVAAGDRTAGHRALWRAWSCSPAHVAYLCIRDENIRHTSWTSLVARLEPSR